MKKTVSFILSVILLICYGCSAAGQTGPNAGAAETNITDEPGEQEKVPLATPENSPSMTGSVSVGGPHGRISVTVPDTWQAEAAPVDSDKLSVGLYGLIIKPQDESAGQIELFCSDTFGVCGTGLSEKKAELAGYTVSVGTYDDHEHWDYIAFGSNRPQIVAIHTDCSSWTEAMWDEAYSVLDTVVFDETITEGGIGQFIPESENDEIAVIMEVRQVTPGGLTVCLRQYAKREGTTLIFGEYYTLEKLEGSVWTAVPRIIDNAAFHDIGYLIPAEGEAELKTDWERLYGRLSPGTYRIGKSVWNTHGTARPEYELKAQFIIAGES